MGQQSHRPRRINTGQIQGTQNPVELEMVREIKAVEAEIRSRLEKHPIYGPLLARNDASEDRSKRNKTRGPRIIAMKDFVKSQAKLPGRPQESLRFLHDCIGLCNEHDALVWTLALRGKGLISYFRAASTNLNIDAEDAAQEALIGLYNAACRFEPGYGEFTTYAVPWIKANILRKNEQNETLVKQTAFHGELGRLINKLVATCWPGGRTVTPVMIQEKLLEVHGRTIKIEKIIDVLNRPTYESIEPDPEGTPTDKTTVLLSDEDVESDIIASDSIMFAYKKVESVMTSIFPPQRKEFLIEYLAHDVSLTTLAEQVKTPVSNVHTSINVGLLTLRAAHWSADVRDSVR